MTFDEWWDKEIDDSENPYTKDSPIYWAFAGWQARESELNRWKELAEYRLALLTKMPEDKQWAGLTDDEKFEAASVYQREDVIQWVFLEGVRFAEDKLKEKNSG